MKINYDEKVDILYINLKETDYYESDEIKEGVILDYDKNGNVIAIEIMDASIYMPLHELSTVHFNINREIKRQKIVSN